MDGDAVRVAGQDGTGGLAALWCVGPDRALAAQPVVFPGSEGACGVVTGRLSDFPWVLADGVGPMEAVGYEDLAGRPDPVLVALAERYASTPRRPAEDVVLGARAESTTFAQDIETLRRRAGRPLPSGRVRWAAESFSQA